MRRTLFAISIVCLSFLTSATAPAAIIFDPGAVGSSTGAINIPLPSLVGQPLDGSSLEFHVEWQDMKHIELSRPLMPGDVFSVGFATITTPFTSPGAAPAATNVVVYLTDMDGLNIFDSWDELFDGGGTSNGIDPRGILTTPVPVPFFHDFHVSFDLPVRPGVTHLAGGPHLFVRVSPPGPFDPDIQLVVGEWAPVIPEPSTYVIWSVLGLVGAGVRWRRKRKAA